MSKSPEDFAAFLVDDNRFWARLVKEAGVKLAIHPDGDPAKRAAIKRAILDAFYVDADDWKGKYPELVLAIIPAENAAELARSLGVS